MKVKNKSRERRSNCFRRPNQEKSLRCDKIKSKRDHNRGRDKYCVMNKTSKIKNRVEKLLLGEKHTQELQDTVFLYWNGKH